MRKDFPRAVVALLCSLALALPALAQGGSILLASTTSTENSGLFSHLLPRFRAATGIEVRVVAVGTGQAFALARNGDVDALLVHDMAGELAMVREGFALERRDVMFNDYVIVGPGHDPAAVSTAGTAVEGLARIARAEAVFASRGDDSGTHRAELRVWHEAGIQPHGSWYRELGSGMGATLNTAAAMDAYALADRATWSSFANRQHLRVLLAGDPALFNQYGSLLLNPARHPHLKHDLAVRWHAWLLSDTGQSAIAEFRLNGEQVFFPNAE